MSEEVFEVFGVRFTITGIYGVLSALVLILFMSLWLFGRKKRSGKPIHAGQVINGVGFGLLPALAVLKAFQEMSTGAGAPVTEPLPLVAWLTEAGYFRPGRIETAAASVFFVLVCLWLILRKAVFPDNGDLLMITVCLWAAIRQVTEDFRAEPMALFHYTSSGTILFCMLVWGIRMTKATGSPVRMILNTAAAASCLAVNILTFRGILSSGSGIGDLAVKAGSILLALTLTLIAGGDLRKMTARAGNA